jgi:hypothetical protein
MKPVQGIFCVKEWRLLAVVPMDVEGGILSARSAGSPRPDIPSDAHWHHTHPHMAHTVFHALESVESSPRLVTWDLYALFISRLTHLLVQINHFFTSTTCLSLKGHHQVQELFAPPPPPHTHTVWPSGRPDRQNFYSLPSHSLSPYTRR